MKKIIGYIIAVAALVLAASCTRELDNSFTDGEVFAFELSCAEMTKAGTPEGIGTENEVVSLDYFFYADTTAAAVFHYRVDNPTLTDLKFRTVFEPGVSYGGKVFPTKETLYGGSDHTTVFIVANMPSSITIGSTLPTLADLKSSEIDQTFAVIEKDAEGKDKAKALPTEGGDDVQKVRLVMTAQADVKGSLAENYNQLMLERLAAKVSFNITIKGKTFNKTTEGYTETWTPMLYGENVRVYLEKAVTNAVLGAADEQYPESLGRVDYANVFPFETNTYEGAPTQATITVGPFYTYPVSWEEDLAQSTYGKFIIPWQVERVSNGQVIYSSQPEVYYKVVMPEMAVLSNNFYDLTVEIEPLGTEFQPEVTILATCQVINWADGGAGKVNSQVSDVKYLTVDRSKEVSTTFGNTTADANVFSGPSNQVQYNASGAVQINWTQSRIYYYDYSGSTTQTRNIINTNGTVNTNYTKGATSAQVLTEWVKTGVTDGDQVYLQINHALINDMTNDNFDSSPYYFDLDLCLTSDNTVHKNVKFVQEPAMFIVAQSSSNPFVYANPRNTDEVYDDNAASAYNHPASNAVHFLGGVSNSASNQNQYVITVSVLDNTLTSAKLVYYGNSTENMVIGDPRGEEVKLSTLDLGGNSDGDKTYRPTADGRQNYIAPKIRVASNWGNTDPTSYQGAQKRCAAYQENGYPAGRWRLPTAAEIQFIMTLSDKGRIPNLFLPTARAYYWAGGKYGIGGERSSQATGNKYVARDLSSYTNFYWATMNDGGRYTGYMFNYGNYQSGSDSGNNNNTHRGAWTRCVYDEWYWGEDKLSNANSWGGFRTDFINQ